MLSVHSYWLLIFPGALCNNLSIKNSIYYTLSHDNGSAILKINVSVNFTDEEIGSYDLPNIKK